MPSKLPSIRHGHHIPYNTVCAPGGFRSGQTLQRCDAARRLSRLRGVSALRRCEMACGRFRVFATSRRCDAATPLIAAGGTSSRHCDAATSLGSPRVFTSLRRCDASGVLLASSRLRDAAKLRCRRGGSSPLRIFTTLRRCRWRAPRVFASSDLAAGGRSLLRSGAMLRRRERRCDAATLGWVVGGPACGRYKYVLA